MADEWGADVPVSMPQPPANDVLVPMFGFGFTVNGLVHDITESEREELATPWFAPLHSPGLPEVRGNRGR